MSDRLHVARGVAIIAIVTTTLVSGAAAPAGAPANEQATQRALLDKYCVTCHNQRMKVGGLTLDSVSLDNLPSNAELWEQVARKLRTGMMPPAGRPRPEKAEYEQLVGWIEGTIDRAAASAPNPGRPAIHRLNRAEYTNAIRDLLGLEIDGRTLLPADDSGYGFDNIGDALTISPGLLERYLLAAKKIGRLAIGDPTILPSVQTYQISPGLLQEDRVSDELSQGTRGGLAVRHLFPVDGEYAIRVHLQRHSLALGHRVRGLDDANLIDVRLDGEPLKQFSIGGKKPAAAAANGTDGDAQSADRRRSASENDEPEQGFEVRVAARAGLHTVGVTIRKVGWYVEGVGVARLPVASDAFTAGLNTTRDYGRIDAGIDTVEVAGPYAAISPAQSPTRQRLFVCGPTGAHDEEACARTIIATFARRAFRRPVSSTDVTSILKFYTLGRANGGFDKGIQAALESMLTDPDFLFRAETQPASVARGAAYAVSDLDLASRLSFFLWSTIPDDELLRLAEAKRLRAPAVLEQQVRRMLADPKAEALLSNFFGQWLLTRNMRTITPDPKAFPEFDDSLRAALQRETELFLESQFNEDRPVGELLTANYTFVNERLARHYNIPYVYGSHFRRITLPDSRRAGLLGQASVLTATSYPNRTSPVIRGKWLLENLIGAPPPPPPANVPPLDDTKVQGSLRQRMEMHRKNPVCAACHAQMDPLGFALENFNGIGGWRNTDGGVAIDSSGSLPNGAKFNTPEEFRKALGTLSDALVLRMTEKLLTYALGRGVEFADMPAVRRIVQDSKMDEYRWSSLIVAITKSQPFQMRRAES